MWNSREKLCSITPTLFQGSKATARFHYTNCSSWVVFTECYRFTNKHDYSGVVVNEVEVQSSNPSFFPRW